MRNIFDLTDMTDIMGAMSNYTTHLSMSISHAQAKYDPEMAAWNKEKEDKYKAAGGKNNWWWDRGYEDWKYFNIHNIVQNWSSTSAGWGGIGGAAMTDTRTTIIENYRLGLVFVYYGQKCVYIIDANAYPSVIEDWNKIPAYFNVKRGEKGCIWKYRHDYEWKTIQDAERLEQQVKIATENKDKKKK